MISEIARDEQENLATNSYNPIGYLHPDAGLYKLSQKKIRTYILE